ncbi:MAG: hypothetical protein ABIB43_05945 [archaeon]
MFKINNRKELIDIIMALDGKQMKLDELSSKFSWSNNVLNSYLTELMGEKIIKKKRKGYIINKKDEVLDKIAPWINYEEGQFTDIAKNVAEIILTRSYDNMKLKDVMLYGSLVRKEDDIRDIDFIIFHDGHRLPEFMRDPRGRNEQVYTNIKNKKIDSFSTLESLGYPGTKNINLKENYNLMRSESVIAKVYKILEPFRFKPYNGFVSHLDIDRTKLTYMFEIQTLSTKLFTDEGKELRDRLLQTGRDPHFWEKIFSEGKLYNQETKKFDIEPKEKYNVEVFKN